MSKIQDANNAARFFVTAFNTINVNSDNMLLWVTDNEPVMVKVKENEKPIYLFSENLPKGNDYWLYNPFLGSIVENNADKTMYGIYRTSINSCLYQLIFSVLKTALVQKDLKVDSDVDPQAFTLHNNKTLINLFGTVVEGLKGKLIDEIDEKSVTEIYKYFEHDPNYVKELVTVSYTKNDISSNLLVDILSDDFMIRTQPIQIRKKSLHILRCIVGGILGVTGGDLSRYMVTAEENVPFKFWTVMSVYFKIYTRIHLLYSGYENFDKLTLVDLEQFQEYLDDMDSYKLVVKNFIKIAPPDTEDVAVANPQPASSARIPTRQPAYSRSRVPSQQYTRDPYSRVERPYSRDREEPRRTRSLGMPYVVGMSPVSIQESRDDYNSRDKQYDRGSSRFLRPRARVI